MEPAFELDRARKAEQQALKARTFAENLGKQLEKELLDLKEELSTLRAKNKELRRENNQLTRENDKLLHGNPSVAYDMYPPPKN